MNLTEYLNNSTPSKQVERVDESVILSAIICTACVGYAAGPIFNNEFMKSVGGGIGALLTGMGGMFANIGFGFGGHNKNKIKELLAKDPDDLTQNEKELVKKAAADPKIKGELTDKELKKVNRINGSSSTDDKIDTMDDDDAKELHAILKKKPEDMTPKEKERLKELHGKYNLSNELSDKEIKSFEKATGSKLDGGDSGDNDDDNTNDNVTPEQISEAMVAMAAAANENEKDPEKKKKNAALIDIITASTYDDDGNPLSMDKRIEKMKGLVGEDNWETFKADIDEVYNNIDEKKAEEELKKAKKQLNPDYIKELQDNQKNRAKEAAERIAKENKEIADLEKELEDLKKDPEANKDKITKLENKRKTLINNSTMGIASPNTAKAATSPKQESKKDKVRKEQDKEIEAINKKHLKEFDKLQNTYADKMRNAKSDDERKDLEKELQDKTKELQDKTKADLDDIENLGEEYQTKLDKAFADYTEKSNKELETFTEKTKNMDVNSDEYKEAQKEYDNKIKQLESDRDTTIEDAIEKAWSKKKNDLDEKEGKFVEKEEEITDPETGEKKKVTTYTGPRGGKFYYPEGKPKKPENKVYIKESLSINHTKYLNLTNFLLESLNK